MMMINLSESHMSAHGASIDAASKRCLCQFVVEEDTVTTTNDPTLRCPACVQRYLKPHLERHELAMLHHAEARTACAQHLARHANPKARLSELQCESQRLRDRLSMLRKECADMAVRVASQAVENDDRRESMDMTTEMHRLHLARLDDSLLEGAMVSAITVATNQVRALRFQWARKALVMHRLDVDPEDANDSKHAMSPLQKRRHQQQQQQNPDQPQQLITQRRARGIGKIGGLPLPNAGPELYGVLPPKELQSALRLVASMTSTVARCLGIVLPHPILLTPTGNTGDITDTVPDQALQAREKEDKKREQQQQQQQKQQQQLQPPPPTTTSYGLSSTSSLMSLMDGSWKRSAKKAFKQVIGQGAAPSAAPGGGLPPQTIATSANNTFIPPSMDAGLVSKRLHHATAAVLAEDESPTSSKFALSADEGMHRDDFAIALQLLQNNVIALCIRAGVPVSKLWPAEAMLLNLYALDAYCAEQTIPPY
jgi:hypothetical protein